LSYVEKNLLPGEVVKYRTRLHWSLYVPSVLLTLLVMVPIAIALVINLLGVFAVIPIVVGAAFILAAHVRRLGSEFAVTNKRVVIKLGVMTTRSLELLLPKVEGIAVNQGMGGKLWGYGDIVVTGSGGTKESFSGIQDPLALRRAIQEATDAREGSTGG
jgi:uncharacterized membrane protein YdbT with pleckstrin-like domain